MTKPKVVIIILNWNGKIDTLGLLKTLSKIDYPNYQIVLVDNGSTDGSVKRIRELYPDLTIIENKKNLGFAEGNNIGLRYALKEKADFILILNNDTLVSPDFLTYLVSAAMEAPQYSVFAPQIRLYPAKNKIWYGGGRIVWPIAVNLHFDRNQPIEKAKLNQPTEVSFVTGAAMMVKREVIEKVGFLDSNFFCYWEETDWEARMTKEGLKFLYVPHSVIWHKVAKTSGGTKNPQNQYYYYRNWLLFAKKNLARHFWPTFLLFLLARLFLFEFPKALLGFIILKPAWLVSWGYAWFGIRDFLIDKFGPRFSK